MTTTTALFNILASALSIWDGKEKTKYQDEKISLEKEFYEEYNKPIYDYRKPKEKGVKYRRDAVLDDIQLKLCILVNNVATAIGTKNTRS